MVHSVLATGLGVGAKRADPQGKVEAGVVFGRNGLIVAAEPVAAIAAHLDFATLEQVAHHAHPVFGQRAGLVGQDDGRGPQCLDRRQLSDQRIARTHAPHPPSKAEGRDDGQTFGHRGHGQRDARLHHLEQVRAAQDAAADCQRGQGQRQPHQPVPQPVEPLFQWCDLGLGAARQIADAPDLGLHAGRHRDAEARSLRDRGALERHVGAVADLGLGVQRVGGFFHGR